MCLCRKRAWEEITVPVSAIYQQQTNTLLESRLDLITSILTYENIKTGLTQQRRQAHGVPQDATNAVTVAITDEVKFFEDGSLFLQCDDIVNGKRIVVFAHENLRKPFAERDTLFLDGTFSSCSKQFYPLYTVHADLRCSSSAVNVAPVIFALLADKTEITCTRLF